MSLEEAIRENTAAIRDLINVGSLGKPQLTGSNPPPVKKEAAEGDAPAAPKAAAKQNAPRPAPTAKPAAPTATASKPPAATDAYTPVKNATLEFIKKKGRDAAVAILGEFGAKLATDLDPASYDEYLARLNEESLV